MSIQDEQIAALQALFDCPIPRLVYEWLSRGEPRVAGGLPLLGLPIGPSLDNAWGATRYLQSTRPEFPRRFLVVRLLGEKALCLDLAQSDRGTLLGVIDCASQASPTDLHKTFEEYLSDGAQNDDRAHKIFDRVDRILKTCGYSYDHAEGGKLPRAHEWRIVRSCVHDRLVGVTALRQDDQRDTTEVDLFEVADHPLYEPGHALCSLLSLIFADAYKAGSSMRLLFTEVGGLRGAVIPRDILDFALSQNITIARPASDVIEHSEGARLFASAVGLSTDLIETLSKRSDFTLDAVSYLAATRVWTTEEIEWLLHVCPEPGTVLFGTVDQTDWLNYTSALSWARAVSLVSMFRTALNEEGEEGVETSSMYASGQIFLLRLSRRTTDCWSAGGVALLEGETVAILPRPRYPLKFEGSLLLADAKLLSAAAPKASHKIVLLSGESQEVDVKDIESQLRDLDVRVACSPYFLPDLDALVEARFARARRVRR